MSAPIKKVAEATAKKVIPMASRAVSAAEAKDIAPNVTSSTESVQPWKGWISSFLSDKLGSDRFDKLRRMIVYKPDDENFFEQQPTPDRTYAISQDGTKTAQYRTPSPGSQSKEVRQPVEDPGTTTEDPYNVSYYSRDTKRRYADPAFPNPELEEMKLALLPQDDPNVKEALEKFNEGAMSSPGNNGRFATGQSDFDPTGLRATMSSNHASLNASLDANEPNHVS